MKVTAHDLVANVSGLITLPDVYLRISRLLDNPASSVSDIAETIANDPSFVIRLLRVANSPFYRLPSSVSSVTQAVTMIGTSQIRNLALSLSVASSFAGLPNELVSMKNFWRHSLYCALVARYLAKMIGYDDREALFTAGLLHDIGELIIFNRLPKQARDALTRVLDSDEELPVYLAEQQAMGFDHSHVGAELAREWHLPSLLVECIAHHHRINEAVQYPREVALIHICNVLAQKAELDTSSDDDVPRIDPAAWRIVCLDEDQVEPALRLAKTEIAEVLQLFASERS